MNIFPQHVLDSLVSRDYRGPDGEERHDGRADPPGAMLAWAVEGRMMEQPHRWQPDQGGITENHKLQVAAAWLWHTRCAPEYVRWCLGRLRLWEVQGEQLGEQCPSGYDGHHVSALVTIAVAAKAAGEHELYELAWDTIRCWVALRLRCSAPGDAHRSVAGRSFIAGRRCVRHGHHVDGSSLDRDIALHLLTGRPVPRWWDWPIHQAVWMEPHLVAALAPGLPTAPMTGEPLPTLEDPLHIQQYRDGHASWMPESTMRSGRGGAILWGVAVRYSTGEVWEVSWHDPLKLPFNDSEARRNPRRPIAREMPGGPMPAPLEVSHLGPRVGPEIVVGGSASDPVVPPVRPPAPPDKEPPMPPDPPDPNPPPDPDLGTMLSPRRWLIHVQDPATTDPHTLVVETRGPGNLIAIREHRD